MKELLELVWVSWFIWALAQSPILHPHNHMVHDWVCPLGLLPIISGHRGDLQTVPYQVAAVCLNSTHRALEGGLLHGSHHCYGDSVVCAQYIGHTSIWARAPWTRHLHQCWSFLLYNTTKNYNWQGWPPSSGLQHPALL